MIFEFPKGVSIPCVIWLCDNIGQGNMDRDGPYLACPTRDPKDKWFYRSVTWHNGLGNRTYISTIEIYNKKDAAFFALKWR